MKQNVSVANGYRRRIGCLYEFNWRRGDFIPVVLSVASRMKISPGRLMMPLSFAGLISGMMTLVATPPNMVVNSELVREGIKGFGFFGVTPIGIIILFMGVAYMLVARRWLGQTRTH